ncbi:molybdopterin-guanine dinucleotide biosynthesis protein B [Aquibacillus halophilus]|uniref:Molybdopterin-guanine dinucleotide biosynthesis protein B n=1 Tax=Aquibacillus halophilus TaxID=930132 RepID=A0A6A8DLR0_9BACI|nr:molybdopterin-guanine dinucleotide biosynthesis protein B [Aquibacillus halophilus]
MKTVQVVGYKNSGKTTMSSFIIENLTRHGLEVAALKHHGHGGVPTSLEDNDSAKHHQAGAVMSGVQGEDILQLTVRKERWSIEQIVAFYSIINPEVLIIEGYKNLDFPKIVMIRSEEDLHLLDTLTNVKAVVTDMHITNQHRYQVFTSEHKMALIEWLLTHLKS